MEIPDWTRVSDALPELDRTPYKDKDIMTSRWLLGFHGFVFWTRLLYNRKLDRKWWYNSGGLEVTHWTLPPSPPSEADGVGGGRPTG